MIVRYVCLYVCYVELCYVCVYSMCVRMYARVCHLGVVCVRMG